MRINSYEVGMESARTYSSSQARKLSLSYTRQDFQGTFANLGNAYSNSENHQIDSGDNTSSDSMTKEGSEYDTAMNAFNSMRNVDGAPSITLSHSRDIAHTVDEFRQQIIRYLWQALFGRNSVKDRFEDYELTPVDNNGLSVQSSNMMSVNVSFITLHGYEEYQYTESESVSFHSKGSVITEDGRAIDFNMDIEMDRSFTQYSYNEYDSVVAMCDPLVINYDGDIADLSDQKFYFDLDADGKMDEISNLAAGNGFIALDNNRDGIINDGSELFGTKSGNGFADLAKYDSDGNGWIDENDEIFDDLKIWVVDSKGESQLYTLKEKNVGAIYLGNSSTDYTLRSMENGSVNGAIRNMGVFLYEDGTGVGNISHLDIAN